TTTGFIWFKWAKSYHDYIPTTSTTTLPSSTTSSPTSASSSSTTSLPTVSSTTSTTSLTYMNGGDQRGQGQSYGGGLPLSEFNKLVPPGWRPGIPGYPIKLFFERLKLWYRVTDNAEAQLGILVAGRLQGAPQKIALRLRLPRPVAAGGGYDIGDEALIRLSQEQVIDPANNTIVQEYIPSGLQFLCQALRAIYGLQDQDRTTVALDSFYEFKRGHLGLAEFAQEFDHRYESAEDEAGLQMNDTGKTYFFLRGSGLGDKIIEDIKLQMRGDMSRYQEIRTLVLKLARANDKDKETLNMYQDQTDFNYKVNLDETNGNYYGSWHDPTTGEIIEYDYGANTSDDMYYGDYDCVYDGEYSDYDGAGYDDDWYGDDGWQDEVYHGGQTKGKGKGFGAKGKGPSGGSASGIGCATCGSRWHSSLDCPLNDPSKGDQGKGKGGKDYHYENFWKGKGKGKKGGKSKGFGKGWSKGFGKYRPSFGSGKGYGKYSGGYGKSYGKSYGKGKFKGGYGGFRYSSPYNFTAFQDYEVQEAPEHAPTIAFKADGSGAQYYDFEDDKPSSSTRPPPQSTTEPMIDTAGNPGYNDGYGELDTATAPVPDVRVNSLSFLVGTCSSAFPTDHEDWSSLYHSVRGVKRHGLLIDPGAASGLIGSDTLKEFRDEILLPLGVDIICRPTTQNVSGISGKPEPALSRVTMPIFPGIKSSTFTADVIGKQGSKCPALLPNPSMRAANMGLLTNFFENGDGMLIVHDNGKRLLYRCLLTESGHYILPTDNVKNNNNVDKEATRKASAFYAAVLQDATQQWSDISSVYLAVDKAAVADPVADRVTDGTGFGTGWLSRLCRITRQLCILAHVNRLSLCSSPVDRSIQPSVRPVCHLTLPMAFRCLIPKRLILIRHGESEGNVNSQIYESEADSLLHLTDQGWQQAMCAGRALKEEIGDEPVRFEVSPYVRTRESFNAIVLPWGSSDDVKWSEDPRLREQDFGNFQDLAEINKAKEERGRFGPFYYRMPSGESPADVYDRLSSYFESMHRSWERAPQHANINMNHIIVCHGVTISAFLMRMFKYSVDDFHKFENFGNAEFCVLERHANGKYCNDQLYCVKPTLIAGHWQAVRGPRSVRPDAGRFDRAINSAPPSALLKPALDRARSKSDSDRLLVKEFRSAEKAGGIGLGFRCDDSNRVEAIIEKSQADSLGVMPGWYLLEVDGATVPEGGARAAMRHAMSSGGTFNVKFNVRQEGP
ncbi:unnamed protein product, partial [Polarella glacialis]